MTTQLTIFSNGQSFYVSFERRKEFWIVKDTTRGAEYLYPEANPKTAYFSWGMVECKADGTLEVGVYTPTPMVAQILEDCADEGDDEPAEFSGTAVFDSSGDLREHSRCIAIDG